MEALFQLLPVAPPPAVVELRGHHFEQHHLVTPDLAAVVFPQAGGGRAGERRDPAEHLRQLVADRIEHLLRERRAALVAQRQEQFDQVHRGHPTENVRRASAPACRPRVNGHAAAHDQAATNPASIRRKYGHSAPARATTYMMNATHSPWLPHVPASGHAASRNTASEITPALRISRVRVVPMNTPSSWNAATETSTYSAAQGSTENAASRTPGRVVSALTAACPNNRIISD